MAAALFIALAFVVSSACAALSWRHPARAASLTAGDARALARSIRALPVEARPPELSRRAEPGSWERRFALALMEVDDAPARTAAANDLLAEAAHRLDAGAGWPSAATRIAAFSAMLFATLAFLIGPGASAPLLILAIGAAGALASIAAGRRGRAEVARQREAIDALVAATLGPLGADAGEGAGPCAGGTHATAGRRASWRSRHARG